MRWSPSLRWSVIGAGFVVFVCACGTSTGTGQSEPPPTIGLAEIPTSAVGLAPSVTAAPEPTQAPTQARVTGDSEQPGEPTIMGNPNKDQFYLSLAQGGLVTPIVRPGLPAGEWKAAVLLPGDVQITMPISIGTPAQTVRLGKLAIAQVTKALFDGAPELERVNVIGTTPDGADGAELPAISIVVERAAFAQWDGTAESLGPWQVSQRLQ